MARRYGRNQKRAARAREAALRLDLAREERLKWAANDRAREAETRAFQRFAESSGLLRHVVEMMAERVAEKLGDELAPIAQRIWRDGASYQRAPMVALGASADVLTRATIVQVEVPALRYRYVVTDVDFAMARPA